MDNTFYIKRLKKGSRYYKHKSLLYILLQMSKKCGAVLNPIDLSHKIKEWLDKNKPSQNNIEKARNSAYVFACLCNEFRLKVKFDKVWDEFFMTNDLWDKYMIGRKIRQSSLNILQEMGWITATLRTIRREPIFRPYMINIHVGALAELMPEIKNFRANCTSEEWGKELDRVKSVNKLNSKYDDDKNFDDYHSLDEMFDAGWYFC